jgi:hypothetical protein
MKKNILLAVLLAALFLAPFYAAHGEDAPVFTLDETVVLRGMDRSLRQGYTPSMGSGRWNLVLPVRSEAAVGSITAELILPESCTSFFRGTNLTSVAQIEDRGIWGVRLSPAIFSSPKNADYPCVIRLTGKDAQGNSLTADIPYMIEVRGATASVEKVRIEIKDVQADLSVGEEGAVKITVANPCAAVNIQDLELKISDSSNQILPLRAESVSAGSLPIGETLTVTYPVTVLEKATVAPHVLKLDFSWTALGQASAYSCSYTVPVRQEIRLEQGGVRMAPSVAAGDAVSVTLPLMNMGKADVINTMATVSMPGVTERQSVLVGTIQPGETKQAQLILSPGKDIKGDFDGELAVECTDQDGNSYSFTLPLRLTVTEPVLTVSSAAGTAEKKQEAKTPVAVWVLAGGCGFLLILLLTQGTLLRRKVHMLEEAKL